MILTFLITLQCSFLNSLLDKLQRDQNGAVLQFNYRLVQIGRNTFKVHCMIQSYFENSRKQHGFLLADSIPPDANLTTVKRSNKEVKMRLVWPSWTTSTVTVSNGTTLLVTTKNPSFVKIPRVTWTLLGKPSLTSRFLEHDATSFKNYSHQKIIKTFIKYGLLFITIYLPNWIFAALLNKNPFCVQTKLFHWNFIGILFIQQFFMVMRIHRLLEGCKKS